MQYQDSKYQQSEPMCYILILYLNIIHAGYIIYMLANTPEPVSISFRQVYVKFITYDTTQLCKPH